MGRSAEKAALRRLIAGAVFDMAGAGLIAFSLLQQQDELLWVGVGLMAVGSMLIVGWAREQSRLDKAGPTAKPVAAWSVEPELALPPPRRVELTSTGRWRLWLWLAAVAAAVLYTNGYPRRAQPMEAAFAEFGVETEAVIHDKQQRSSAGGEPRYYLYYHFHDRRGEQVRASTTVAEHIYSSHREGDTIRLVYLPDDPLSHQVAGVEDNRFRPEGIAALAALLAALTALELQRRRHKRLVTAGSAVGGTVLEVTRTGAASRYTVSAEAAGVERRLRHSERACRLRVGGRVTVLYSPDKPSEVLLYRAAVYRALR